MKIVNGSVLGDTVCEERVKLWKGQIVTTVLGANQTASTATIGSGSRRAAANLCALAAIQSAMLAR